MKASEYNRGCCKNIDICQGMLEGTQDVMGLTKKAPTSQVNCGCDTVTWSSVAKICSQLLSSVSSPLPLGSSHLSLYSHVIPTFLFGFTAFSFFRLPPFSVSMQLHQLRRRTSATTIMPFEGTTEGKGRDRTGEGGVCHGAGSSDKRSRRSRLTGRWADGQTTRPVESKHETFCIVLH